MEDKSKLLNIKSFIKQESGRLASFGNRDLNLGGTKPKKVYAPNLNVVRNKTKPSPNVERTQKQHHVRTSKFPKRNTNNDGRFIQSSGVFSEGAAQVKRPTIYSDKHASIREQETSTGMIKPKLAHNWKVDVKKEATVVDDLLVCDEDSDSENDCDYQPVILPLAANKNGFMNQFKVKKEDIKVKKEPVFNGNSGIVTANHTYYDAFPSFSKSTSFDDDNVSRSLIKLPDSLPGKGFDSDNNTTDYTLSQMLDGKIGKMLIRKSGKVDVIVGDTKYILDTVEAAHFTEELMCISGDEELKTDPAITSLGGINEKFILSPIWPNLLHRKRKYF